ncbi:MAG: CoA ester lyase [Gemmatimonadota bacterium]
MHEGSRDGARHPGTSWWRSLLFVPGSRTDRYPKGLGSGADLVCVDLEDAVAPGEKDSARRSVLDLIQGATWRADRSAVRVNPARLEAGGDDLAALASLPAAEPLTVVVPKVDGPSDVERVRDALATGGREVTLVAMIETARGLENAASIAGMPDVSALFLGAVDLAAELGCSLEWDALLYARSRLVHAAALGGVSVIDVPYLELDDVAGVGAEARDVAALGFTAKAAIHPRQVEPIHDAFRPGPDDVARARRMLDAYHRAGGGVISFEGAMVDRPVVEAARRTLQRAQAPR